MSTSRNKFSKTKYEEKILNEINFSLRKEFADPRLTLVSITHVELNKDYSVCKVYWDTFDNTKRGDAKTAIEKIKGKMRTVLASKLDVRHVPELFFYYNSQFDDENKISKLLENDSPDDE